jgi:hypothetical protein
MSFKAYFSGCVWIHLKLFIVFPIKIGRLSHRTKLQYE